MLPPKTAQRDTIGFMRLTKKQKNIYQQITDPAVSRRLASMTYRDEFIREIEDKVFQVKGVYQHMMFGQADPSLYDVVARTLLFIHLYNFPLIPLVEINEYKAYLKESVMYLSSAINKLFIQDEEHLTKDFYLFLFDTFTISLISIFTNCPYYIDLYTKLHQLNQLQINLKNYQAKTFAEIQAQKKKALIYPHFYTRLNLFLEAFPQYYFYYQVPYITLQRIAKGSPAFARAQVKLPASLKGYIDAGANNSRNIKDWLFVILPFSAVLFFLYTLYAVVIEDEHPLWAVLSFILLIVTAHLDKLISNLYGTTAEKQTLDQIAKLKEKIKILSSVIPLPVEIKELEDGQYEYPLVTLTLQPPTINQAASKKPQQNFEVTPFPKGPKRHQISTPQAEEESVAEKSKDKGKRPVAEIYEKYGLLVVRASNRAGTFTKKFYLDKNAIGTNLERYITGFGKGKIAADENDSGFKVYPEGIKVNGDLIYTVLKIPGGELRNKRAVAHRRKINGKVREVLDEHVDNWHNVINRR